VLICVGAYSVPALLVVVVVVVVVAYCIDRNAVSVRAGLN